MLVSIFETTLDNLYKLTQCFFPLFQLQLNVKLPLYNKHFEFLNRVVFESYCQLVVNAHLCNNISSCVNELGILLSNCRTLLFSNVSYGIAYVRRQANIVAHNIARAFIIHASPTTLYRHPYCIHSIILVEMK